MPATHVIISTHTTRHLRATLLGVAIQRPRPASVTVSIDNDSEEVRELCATCSGEYDLPVGLAWRAWPGQVRVGQVRNNGVRALLDRADGKAGAISGSDWLHFLDGDSVMPPGMLAEAERARAGGTLLVGGRILLTEEQTAAFDLERLGRAEPPLASALSRDQTAEPERRHARYRRQMLLRRLGLVKSHKPKVLGANHACTVDVYRKVDGYDETFLGAWREDDDFGRRVYLAGGVGRVAVRNVCVYHLWHPLNPQKRENWSELPRGNQMDGGADAWRPRAGMTTPLAQAPINGCLIRSGEIVERWSVSGPER